MMISMPMWLLVVIAAVLLAFGFAVGALCIASAEKISKRLDFDVNQIINTEEREG